MKGLRLLCAAFILTAGSGFAAAQEKIAATLYKNPSCTCCEANADYLRANGFNVRVVEQRNMTVIKKKYGVRQDLRMSRRCTG